MNKTTVILFLVVLAELIVFGKPIYDRLSMNRPPLPRLENADRFTKELGYGYVNIYPILLKENGTKVAFHLIHASDHPQAPVLMTRAYRKVCGEIANSPADNQMDLLTWQAS